MTTVERDLFIYFILSAIGMHTCFDVAIIV